MQEELKVSIIVLTYKKFDKLRDNIASIIQQKYSNYEVMICDDGSPNFDHGRIEQLFEGQQIESQVRIIHNEENVGTVRNYNAAIKEATGDIIVPLSQDDVFYDEDTLSDIVNYFQDDKVNICCGARMEEKTGKTLPTQADIDILHNYEPLKLWLRLACKNFIYGAVLYFRRDFILKFGLFDEKYRLLEDYPFVLHVTESGERIYYLDRPTIIYGSGGVSNNASPAFIDDEVALHKHIADKAKTILHSNISKAYMEYCYLFWNDVKNGYSNKEKYKNIIIDGFIVITKIKAKIERKPLEETRFEYLWKLEKRLFG